MNIYKCSQKVNNDWDTYDSFVCVAENEDEARKIFPSGEDQSHKGMHWYEADLDDMWLYRTWCQLKDVQVEYIGVADPGFKNGDVICASFNAG